MKIKTSQGDLVGVLAFYHRDEYQKITICTHPDNQFNQSRPITYKQYYALGDWYYYDGDREQLYNILRDFRPKTQSLTYLISRLEAECGLSKYENVYNVLKRWARNTLNYKSAFVPLITYGIKCLLGSSPPIPTLGVEKTPF